MLPEATKPSITPLKNDKQQVSKSTASTKSDSAITPVAKKPIVKEIKPISNETIPDSILNVIK